MALRLIEIILQKMDSESVSKLLEEHPVLEYREIQLSDGNFLLRILLDAEVSEEVLDLLAKRFASDKSRAIMLAVQATLPRAEEEMPKNEEALPSRSKQPERIAREELYEEIKDAAKCSWTYLSMIFLSTIVATVGLYRDSVPIIIGAMVIAPLLGPNMALALATTLGDLRLLRHAAYAGLVGYAAAFLLSVFFGFLSTAKLEQNEIQAHTLTGFGDIAVALASGCAGALGFTTGISATLIGVMVAVSLVPPLVTFGLLVGNGLYAEAMGAFSLFLMNLVCVNLAAVITFLVQGIQPATWWEKDGAEKATKIALALWALFLAAFVVGIWYFKWGQL